MKVLVGASNTKKAVKGAFSTIVKSSQTFVSSSIVHLSTGYLDDLDGVEEGDGERDQHQQQRHDGQEVGDHPGALLAHRAYTAQYSLWGEAQLCLPYVCFKKRKVKRKEKNYPKWP